MRCATRKMTLAHSDVGTNILLVNQFRFGRVPEAAGVRHALTFPEDGADKF